MNDEQIRLPLWLTAAETQNLLSLSCTSPISCGAAEADLFNRLGEFARAFANISRITERSDGEPLPMQPAGRTRRVWEKQI